MLGPICRVMLAILSSFSKHLVKRERDGERERDHCLPLTAVLLS